MKNDFSVPPDNFILPGYKELAKVYITLHAQRCENLIAVRVLKLYLGLTEDYTVQLPRLPGALNSYMEIVQLYSMLPSLVQIMKDQGRIV